MADQLRRGSGDVVGCYCRRRNNCAVLDCDIGAANLVDGVFRAEGAPPLIAVTRLQPQEARRKACRIDG
jgi:hypothetical protein